MPELPEVELVARTLDRLVSGRTLATVTVTRARLVPATTPAAFELALTGARIERVSRRGKNVIATLDRPVVWITHLRMSGRFGLIRATDALPKFTHARFSLDDGSVLTFSDQRHFARMDLVPADALDSHRALARLAVEPLSEHFTRSAFALVLSTSKRTLKETLLDQSRIAGLGNIYAAEAMYVARADPFARACDLDARTVARLHKAIVGVLEASLAHGSTLDVDPRNIDATYYGGGWSGHWQVYDREGKPCTKCRTLVTRARQGGRSTYYCPRCQAPRA